MEDRRALYEEAARLQLSSKASLDILLDAYDRLEMPHPGKPNILTGVTLGTLFLKPDLALLNPPPMPVVFDVGRACIECMMVEEAYCYVVVTRASRSRLANGPFEIPAKPVHRRACFFSLKGGGVSSYLLVGGIWVPFKNQLGKKAAEGSAKFFETIMTIADKAEGRITETTEVDPNAWTTKNLTEGPK